MHRTKLPVIIALLLILWSIDIHAQVSKGGIPYGFNALLSRSSVMGISLTPPDYAALEREDDSLSGSGLPQRLGVVVPADISPMTSGTWENYGVDKKIWRINITVPGAIGLGVSFTDFALAKGDLIYIYSSDKQQVIGAFTHINNKENKLFATEVVMGESIVIEFVTDDRNIDKSTFNVSEIMVAYTAMDFKSIVDINVSGECHVNTACIEGDEWRDQIKGVVKIMVRIGSSLFWCTGSLMNNTALDFLPLILTADHCALSFSGYSSPEDLSRWIFYFQYEAQTCDDNQAIGTRTLSGAVKLASSSSSHTNGSDFFLVQLIEDIPGNYDPFYLGWDRSDELSDRGVGIHHPDGDVKKISTYTLPLEKAQWGDTPETHIRVIWSATTNGHGVTEGGSSGSPIFDEAGRVIGQLTGGESDCDYTSGPDYYGRFFYSWDRNGTEDTSKLQPYLDPLNTGVMIMEGSYNTNKAIAQFYADETIIPVGSSITFNNLSINHPDTYRWYFEGGFPATSDDSIPGKVYYENLGSYSVTLVVSNIFGSDSLVFENYIKVVPHVYPNPTKEFINILFGDTEIDHQILIYSSLGKLVDNFIVPASQRMEVKSLKHLTSGLYIVKIKGGIDSSNYKILLTP